MLNVLGDFVGELRAAGIPVSMSEHVDAARAITAIDISNRPMLRASLAATMVKNGDHLPLFYTAFDIFFATRSMTPEELLELSADEESEEGKKDSPEGSGLRGAGQSKGMGGGGSTTMSADELAQLLFRALRDGDASGIREGGFGGGNPLRRHGARSPRGWHLLPLSNATKSRTG